MTLPRPARHSPGAPRFQTFSDRGGLLLSRVHVLRGRFFEYHCAFVAVAANVTDEPLEELRQREPENISNLTPGRQRTVID